MKKRNPLILITNDDGITSRGIKAMVEIASAYGRVIVVAPNKPQSGMGHAITVTSGLTVSPYRFEKTVEAHSCTGTPADCVKLAIYHLLKEKPDLCLSGINHGSNVSINVIYSGTMSAALEGALEGVPSAGISLCNNDINRDLTAAKKATKVVIEMMLKNNHDNNLCLNVNVPDIPVNKLKGIMVCRQGKGNWQEYYEEHKGPDGEEFLWLTGKFANQEKKMKDTDLWALDNNYVSVVPINADMTDYAELKKTQGWDINWK
jgi:5'-nucleotidase